MGIPANVNIDFIRWVLTLQTGSKNFQVEINYGEGEPNTPGFKNGGLKKSFEGKYTLSEDDKHYGKCQLYHLKSNQLVPELTLLRINENLYHFLTSQNKLMIGTGGWSYTLNNKEPDLKESKSPSFLLSSNLLKEIVSPVVFVGRTPCREFAAEHHLNASSTCIKLKWKLTLNRDAITHQPTTYSIRKVVDNKPKDVTGRWVLRKGGPSNPDAVIVQLDPDDPDKSILLIAGDENVLFFLHKDLTMYVGDNNFSFTLNRASDNK
ncbi:hypothetical protein WSM22_04040 [Cytophagales bacterium WSM2-2]|nr:hypothetical protein WSM22_04040 [Cytophagales bacterium WSM2-2]